jgi:hypothetical protein
MKSSANLGVIVSDRDPDFGPLYNNPAKNERPFVSPLAWAYFFTYITILSGAFAIAKMLEMGTENIDRLLAKEQIRNLLKATLPDRADFIDANELLAYHHLLDEIEEHLLSEFDRMLRGEDQDTAAVEQAARIMAFANKVSRMPVQTDGP